MKDSIGERQTRADHPNLANRLYAYGLGETSVALDEARERWLEVAALLGELAETTATVWRLAT